MLLNGDLLRYSTLMMSEIPFLLFSTLALYGFTRINSSKILAKDPFFYLFFASLVGSFYIRTAGLALLAGVALSLLLLKNWKLLSGVLAGYALLVAPWVIRGKISGGDTYISQLLQINPYKPELGRVGAGKIIARFRGNAERYVAREIPNGIFNIHAEKIEPAGWLIGIAIAPVIIYGLFRLGNHRGLIAGYLAGALGILLLWPESWFGIRFLLPIVPLLLFCLLNGLYQLLCLAVSKTAIKRRPSPLFLILLVFLLFPHLKHVHALAEFGRYPESYQNYLEIARWVNENTAGDSVVCCRKPFMFYLYANRYVTT